jgi:hypothetical protein
LLYFLPEHKRNLWSFFNFPVPTVLYNLRQKREKTITFIFTRGQNTAYFEKLLIFSKNKNVHFPRVLKNFFAAKNSRVYFLKLHRWMFWAKTKPSSILTKHKQRVWFKLIFPRSKYMSLHWNSPNSQQPKRMPNFIKNFNKIVNLVKILVKNRQIRFVFLQNLIWTQNFLKFKEDCKKSCRNLKFPYAIILPFLSINLRLYQTKLTFTEFIYN